MGRERISLLEWRDCKLKVLEREITYTKPGKLHSEVKMLCSDLEDYLWPAVKRNEYTLILEISLPFVSTLFDASFEYLEGDTDEVQNLSCTIEEMLDAVYPRLASSSQKKLVDSLRPVAKDTGFLCFGNFLVATVEDTETIAYLLEEHEGDDEWYLIWLRTHSGEAIEALFEEYKDSLADFDIRYTLAEAFAKKKDYKRAAALLRDNIEHGCPRDIEIEFELVKECDEALGDELQLVEDLKLYLVKGAHQVVNEHKVLEKYLDKEELRALCRKALPSYTEVPMLAALLCQVFGCHEELLTLVSQNPFTSVYPIYEEVLGKYYPKEYSEILKAYVASVTTTLVETKKYSTLAQYYSLLAKYEEEVVTVWVPELVKKYPRLNYLKKELREKGLL